MINRIWRNYEGKIFERDGRVVIHKIVRTKSGRKDKRYLGDYVIAYDEHDKANKFKTLVNDLRNMRIGRGKNNS
jgi:hypothetical protein